LAQDAQIITNATVVRSYDLATGDLLWSCGGQVANPIPSPVRLDDFVVCMTGYRGNAIFALPLSAKGDISNSDKIRWKNGDAAPYVASPTLYKGQLYFSKERTGAVSSIDARTGKVLFPATRLSEIRDMYASPVAAGDKIYFTSRDGVTVVIRHGGKLEELAINKLGEPVDASPALIGDTILIRGAENLYLIGK
jgi:outer membrane protein assembly factor BamB